MLFAKCLLGYLLIECLIIHPFFSKVLMVGASNKTCGGVSSPTQFVA